MQTLHLKHHNKSICTCWQASQASCLCLFCSVNDRVRHLYHFTLRRTPESSPVVLPAEAVFKVPAMPFILFSSELPLASSRSNCRPLLTNLIAAWT
mmetsp:Transcript_13317/g.24065  ORF Transcript_13317/g.24065 Transcript_13317/m.24065 type:complete len:96 (+) Transcript_13317:65-352(+)